MKSIRTIFTPVRAWMPETPGDWLWFCRQQALACVFPWSILAFLALTRHFPPPCVPRYDAILIFCLIVQYALYRAGWESEREVKVIASFHVLGLMLELHKTSLGCWSYPEPSWLRIGRVPLYSGFMYASVASYCCQAWRRLELAVEGWPASWKPVFLASAIYANFFTERFIGDWRWVLIPLVFLTFARTTVRYRLRTRSRAMPLAASLTGIGAAIWIAENISTRCGAWRYPYQQHAWRFVDTGKLSSWFLLVVVTFLIVAQLKRIPKKERKAIRAARSKRTVTTHPSLLKKPAGSREF